MCYHVVMKKLLPRHPKFRIGVLASTRGTDLQALMDEIKKRKMPGVKLAIVASDVENCGALLRAKEAGFDTAWVDPKGKSGKEFDRELMSILDPKKVDLVCLIGFMRILSAEFVRRYRHRIINVHPSLLPKYGGKGFLGDKVHEAVIESGDKVTGMTIHIVDEGCDTGPIVHQAEVPVEEGDTVLMLRGKVQTLEKKWYPEVIRWIQHGKIIIGDGECMTCGNIKNIENAFQKFGWENDNTYLPASVLRLEIVRGRVASRSRQIRKCPECGTYYLYENSYEFFVNGAEDEQSIKRLTDAEAKKYLKQKDW